MQARACIGAIAVAMTLVIVTAPGATAGPGPAVAPTTTHAGVTHRSVGPNAHRLLYDQNDNASGAAILSQKFEQEFNPYDSRAADDFTVPVAERWRVKEVDVTGVYFNGTGPANSENVIFYASALGRPGPVIHRFQRVVGADDGTGSFAIDLGRGVQLAPGHYWVSVQANMAFSQGGEWGWETRVSDHHNLAVWQNPNDGFSSGCTSYRRLHRCFPPGEGEDLMFALRGDKQGGSS